MNDTIFRDVKRAQEAANFWYLKMQRLAELSEHIAGRLYLKRNWTPDEQDEHSREVAEREAILTETRPSYGDVMAKAREIGAVEPARPEKMIEGEDGWSAWRSPRPGYRMVCCDCGLVHEMQFRIVQDYEKDGNGNISARVIEDEGLKVVLRARRRDDGAARDQLATIPATLYWALLAWTGAEPSQSVLAREVEAWPSRQALADTCVHAQNSHMEKQ